jgi:hypothetical protein
MITIDIPKAKDVWKNKIRVARKPVLENLMLILPKHKNKV